MKTIYHSLTIFLITLIFATNFGYGQSSREKRHEQIKEKLQENAHLKYNYFAPSVHIRYIHPDPGSSYLGYYNEILVKKSVKHTYFCTIGFDVGYLGIQDHGSGPLAIFSVWDKGGGKDNSADVDATDQTVVLFSNPKAKSSRFGGEGSGAKTMMPFPWELDKTYSFIVLLTPLPKGTIYTAWIAEKGEEWQKISSYKTVMTKKEIRGFYSFIEDYARNGKTGQEARLALYPDHGAFSTKGWQRILSGSGSIADDIIQNGHSGINDNVFFSQTGADTADFKTKPKQFRRENSATPFAIKNLPEEFKAAE
jgi:hypothetical protein